MMKPKKFDFSGWATRFGIKCTDGRTITDKAFKHADGEVVPIVWNHQHNNPEDVLGKAYLEHRDGEGVSTCMVLSTIRHKVKQPRNR